MEWNRRRFLKAMARVGVGAVASPLIFAPGAITTYGAGSGYKVMVRGGFARERSPGRLEVRALSLEPSFRIKPDGNAPARLKIDIVNVWGERLALKGDGLDDVVHSTTSITGQLDLSKMDNAYVGTEYNPLPGEQINFISVSDTHLGDSIGTDNFDAVLKHVNARRPLFAVDAGDVIDVDERAQWKIFRQKELDRLL